MKQSYFIIAESVNMFPDAKLVIVGTFDVIKAKALPLTFRPFGIAVRLKAEKAEQDRNYKSSLTLRKSRSRNPMITIPWEFTFPKDKSGVVTSAILAIMLPPLKFDSAGKYIFELKIGRKCVASSPLYVRDDSGTGKR